MNFSNLFKRITQQESSAKKPGAQQQSHQHEIENAILVLAAEVIRCNRNYNEATQQIIHQFISTQFGERGIKQRLSAIDDHLFTGTEPFTKIACKALVMLTTVESRITVVRFLFAVAAADDFVNAKEQRCIHRIAGYLKINEAEFKKVKEDFLNQNNPFGILEIEIGATFAEVKSAYRKMILKHHPDKRTEEVTQQEAEKTFREIQQAFEKIKEIMSERE